MAFEVPVLQAGARALLEADVIVYERHGALRVCHHYASEDDVDALFEALRRIGA